MFGASAFESGQPVIANDPADELRAGLPAALAALEAFLGVPLLHFGALVGMVGLANRPGGYDAALVACFEPLWSAVGSILGSVKLDRDRRRADQALRERDALLARLTEHVPAVIFQYRRRAGGDECMPYATEGLRQIYGLAPEHVRDNAQVLHDRIHPEDLPRVRASIAESARLLTPWRLEFRAQHARRPALARRPRDARARERWRHAVVRLHRRHHRAQALPGGAGVGGGGAARQCRQDRVPLAHEPRAAHAAERGARLRAAHADRRDADDERCAARAHRAHRARRRAPARDDQRRARPLAHRGRHHAALAGAAGRRVGARRRARPGGEPGRTTRA